MEQNHYNGFSPDTRRWLASAPLEHRKRLGQYMTPAPLRDRLLDHCDLFAGMRALDPGVGTGEFLKSVLHRQPQAEAHGWDVDPSVLSVARANVPAAHLGERSALEPYQGERFDLVIGNPPYFQFNAPREIRTYYARVISGRVNIFSLFFQAGLEALRPGGQLAYVIPPSMNNGAYFERLRDFLIEHAAIEFLEIHRDQAMFDGARTPVQLLVLRKGGADAGRYVFVRRNRGNGFQRTIFSERPDEMAASFAGRSTLFDLGYSAVTGTVAWNQHKAALRREEGSRVVPLIWAHNVREEVRLMREHKRPQFITDDRPTLAGPAIVSNRIVGAVGSAEFRCALVPVGMEFVAENHINVIREHGHFAPKATWRELLDALQDPQTAARVRLLTGNTQVSATELTHLLPV